MRKKAKLHRALLCRWKTKRKLREAEWSLSRDNTERKDGNIWFLCKTLFIQYSMPWECLKKLKVSHSRSHLCHFSTHCAVCRWGVDWSECVKADTDVFCTEAAVGTVFSGHNQTFYFPKVYVLYIVLISFLSNCLIAPHCPRKLKERHRFVWLQTPRMLTEPVSCWCSCAVWICYRFKTKNCLFSITDAHVKYKLVFVSVTGPRMVTRSLQLLRLSLLCWYKHRHVSSCKLNVQ